jgi:hypothetical protein
LAELGDVVQILLPLSGYLGAWITGDKEGAFQLTKVIAASSLTAHTLKFSAERLRPDGTDSTSFPSGHTTAAYAGAEFIRVRYGNGWGVPAHIAAAFVGYSRIRANKHFADDVLAGATNGMMWNWYFTSPYAEVLDLRPVVLEDGYAVEFSYNFDKKVHFDADYESRPRFRYSVEIGPVTQDKNLFVSPVDTGTVIDLATAENELDFTSRVFFQHFFKPRHEWEAYLAPMELTEFDPGKLVPGPVDFAGKTFVPTPTSEFVTRYTLGELRGVYRYSLVDAEKWYVKVGGGLQYTNTVLDVTQFEGAPQNEDVIEQADASAKRFNVLVSGRIAYNFNHRWRLEYEIDGVVSGDDYLNTALLLNWRAGPGWEFAVGGRYNTWEVDDGTLKNELEWGDVIVKVAHNFF